MTLREKLRHAFAVDKPGPAEPTPNQQPGVDWVCMQIAKRRLTTPGIFMLELSRPLNFIGAQFMHFFRPGVWSIAGETLYQDYIQFSEYLEHRGSMEYFVARIEHFDALFAERRKQDESIDEFITQHMHALRERAVTAAPDSAD